MKAPDCCSCLITIHNRHLDIHKNKIIRTFRRSFHFLNCDFSIFCRFHFCTCHLQNFTSNFSVQLIILNQQNPFSRVVWFWQLLQIISRCFFFSSWSKLPQCSRQPETEQRFCNKSIYTCSLCFFFNFAEFIGCQYNDGDLFSYPLPNLSGCFYAIHIRHLPV